MKKLVFVFVLLIIALFTSCAVSNDEVIPRNSDEIIEEIDDENEEELIEEIEQKEDTVPVNNDSVTEDDSIEDIKIDTGKFKGLADANFFEVQISGVPESVPPKTFMLTDDIREEFQELNLQQDDEIKIHYYETSEGQLIVTDIEKILQ